MDISEYYKIIIIIIIIIQSICFQKNVFRSFVWHENIKVKQTPSPHPFNMSAAKLFLFKVTNERPWGQRATVSGLRFQSGVIFQLSARPEPTNTSRRPNLLSSKPIGSQVCKNAFQIRSNVKKHLVPVKSRKYIIYLGLFEAWFSDGVGSSLYAKLS